jgi:hypothetical protein
MDMREDYDILTNIHPLSCPHLDPDPTTSTLSILKKLLGLDPFKIAIF